MKLENVCTCRWTLLKPFLLFLCYISAIHESSGSAPSEHSCYEFWYFYILFFQSHVIRLSFFYFIENEKSCLQHPSNPLKSLYIFYCTFSVMVCVCCECFYWFLLFSVLSYLILSVFAPAPPILTCSVSLPGVSYFSSLVPPWCSVPCLYSGVRALLLVSYSPESQFSFIPKSVFLYFLLPCQHFCFCKKQKTK